VEAKLSNRAGDEVKRAEPKHLPWGGNSFLSYQCRVDVRHFCVEVDPNALTPYMTHQLFWYFPVIRFVVRHGQLLGKIR
jgi:hypothetical protein